MSRPRFHPAIPVHEGMLGREAGRSSSKWCDFDFRGHPLTAQLAPSAAAAPTGAVDGQDVPTHHFGLLFDWSEWEGPAAHLERSGVDSLIRPTLRFRGKPGEQATLSVKDPSGNVLAFKAFRDDTEIFRNHG